MPKTNIAKEYQLYIVAIAALSFYMWAKLSPEERDEWVADLTKLAVMLGSLILLFKAPWKIGLMVMAGATAFSSIIGPTLEALFKFGPSAFKPSAPGSIGADDPPCPDGSTRPASGLCIGTHN